MNYFEMTEFLEPKCSGCGLTLDYGVNTKFSDEKNAHVCIMCGHTL